MSAGENIRKILLVMLWCVLGSGIVVLLVAAINRKNSKTCKSFQVTVNEGKQRLAVNPKEVSDLLTNHGDEQIPGKTIISFDLKKMEESLKKNAWIQDAQLFFDNQDILRVRITERKPIARIFTNAGNSFFIDSGGVQLPIPEQLSLKLPIVTGFPGEKFKKHGQDSAISIQTRKLVGYILNNPFWMADIEQVAITPSGTFELVPMIGNHLVEFGNANNIEEKFHRLFIFYKEVSAKAGFDLYSRLNVQYSGQVVGTRRGTGLTKSDSIQAIRNIRNLIKSSQQMDADTAKQENIKPLEHNTVTEQTLNGYDMPDDAEDSAVGKSKAITKKTENKKAKTK
ncbi:MAG: cell division protein FtsQ/DivIB [Chitinophagales bacterium]